MADILLRLARPERGSVSLEGFKVIVAPLLYTVEDDRLAQIAS